MTNIEKVKALRQDPNMHLNCAETIMLTYAQDLGLSEDAAKKLATNFGAGMKTGSVCGAITSALMVMGGLGINDPSKVSQFQKKMADEHDGLINCKDLLKANFDKGGDKKSHCDGMVYRAIELIEESRNS